MTTLAARSLLAAAFIATFALAGCAPAAPAPTGDGDTQAASPESPEGSSADCGIYAGQTDPELKLFTSAGIAAGPAEGQVFGDGTELSVTLSQAAIDAGLLPLFDLNSLSESGGPNLISSQTFDPTTGADGTYSTTSRPFGRDELVGTAMVMEVYAISEGTIDGAERYGIKLLLGNYCMTYGNDGS